MIDDSYFTEPKASQLDKMREKAKRKHGRITYDCSNAIVKGDRVVCKKGCLLRRSGSVELISVLKGLAIRKCITCSDYDSEYGEQ